MYQCSARWKQDYSYYTERSDPVKITVTEKPKLTPQSFNYTEDTVSLSCELQEAFEMIFYYYRNSQFVSTVYTKTLSVTLDKAAATVYQCRARRAFYNKYTNYDYDYTRLSDPVKITATEKPKPTVRVNPQSSIYTGDTIILSCELKETTAWKFSWYKNSQLVNTVPINTFSARVNNAGETVYQCRAGRTTNSYNNYDYYYTQLSDPVKITAKGVYVCRGERGEPAFYTLYSNPQPLWISGESPQVSLIISPSRTQHFTRDSLSLSCEDQSNSTGWTVRRYTDSEGVLDCSQWGSVTGSTCNISFLFTSYTGVYWCESESEENSNPVNITVHDGDVILESSVHPVTEGHPLTLHCLYRNTNPSNLRADFYKDGLVIQNQTKGEMIIHKVSKSDEGFYHCKHPERGESPRSWISVRRSVSISGSRPSGEILGVAVGLSLSFLFIILLILMILLWFYKMKKGAVAQLGMNDVTYAEVQLKPMKKVKRAQGREKTRVGDDTVYSELHHNMKTHSVCTQTIGESDEGGSSEWEYGWYKSNNTFTNSTKQEIRIQSVGDSDSGDYTCRRLWDSSQRSETSDAVTLTVSGESPPVSLIISPRRTQYFTRDSLSLSCEDQSNSTGWTVRRYTDSEGVLDCSQWGSVTGSTCNISFLSTSYTGVYWCEPESGENSNPVNITVHKLELLPLGVTTACHPSPYPPVLYICLFQTNYLSSLTTSKNLLLGPPLFLFPDGSILSILLPIYHMSLLCTCPNHLNLTSLTLSPKRPTCAVPIINSFLNLSIILSLNENLTSFNSATSSFNFCLLFN
ncbi:Fc receptor-like protein 5 [Silurus asotus]|uniref:Fc receptor-like protein 5 n=1 Tax=Silurus asotus TaxID=30991 RepID=A0AAD5B606_SILAS|nr:Fc receptor-like protein 5 [Silurus asotus]